MFGITEAHAMEDSGTGRLENPGNIVKRVKRKRSSASSEQHAKQPKVDKTAYSDLEETNSSGTLSSASETSSSISSDRSHLRTQDTNRRARSYAIQKNVNTCNTKRETKRLNGHLLNEKVNTNQQNVKLMELRIVLEDISYKFKEKVQTKIRETDTENDNSGDVWEAEKILAKRTQNGIVSYLIKWKNWSSRYNTWEPEKNLINCSDILMEFEKENDHLIDKFKEQTNFYPNVQDVEQYLSEIQYKGETLDCSPADYNKTYANIRNYLQSQAVPNPKLQSKIKRDILRSLLCTMRKQQLESLNDWEEEMNVIAKGKPKIRVENLVDLEHAPENFFYIDDYLPGADVIIPDDPPIGCECANCDSKSNCCFKQSDCSFPYTVNSRIRIPPGTPIYECNKRCRCDTTCQNRVVQRGSNAMLCIFRTANGRGWGVKTMRSIKKGTFVIDYVGEVITNEEAEKRGKEYDAAGRTYLFDLDYNETEGQCPYTVDAAVYGNVSHFINHSCDPNLAVYGVWINCLDPNLPKLALFATKDIKEHEEITFDYMCQSLKNAKSMRQERDENLSETTESPYEENLSIHQEAPHSETLNNGRTVCKCGAQNCRRYLF